MSAVAVVSAFLVVSTARPSDKLRVDACSAQKLRELEDQLSAALAKTDVAVLRNLWADDFVSTMADGHVPRKASCGIECSGQSLCRKYNVQPKRAR